MLSSVTSAGKSIPQLISKPKSSSTSSSQVAMPQCLETERRWSATSVNIACNVFAESRGFQQNAEAHVHW